jgi:SAM-dependent methyltransferase
MRKVWEQPSERSIPQEEVRVLRRAVNSWFEQPLGRSVQAVEANRLRSVLPPYYGRLAVQLGSIGSMDLLGSSSMPTRALLDLSDEPRKPDVYGCAEALPFDARSIDLVLLPHTLDFSAQPHQVLRETYRVLAPEGHAVILGFNPMSLWGAQKLLSLGRVVPWSGQFIRLIRIRDWLALLDFEWVAGHMIYYRPPLRHERLMERLHFLEAIGDRWWPLGAAVYLIVAKKRVAGMTAIRPAWKTRSRRTAGLRYPVGIRRG